MLALPLGAQRIWQAADPQQSDVDNDNPIQDQRRLRALNAERQKSMVKDTDKLLKLARELDEDVNRPTPGLYNQADYSKAAEIEKLANRVKDKMSTPVQSPQPFPMIRPPSLR
jgi:hypothetical protein